jgi:hypothetical protein
LLTISKRYNAFISHGRTQAHAIERRSVDQVASCDLCPNGVRPAAFFLLAAVIDAAAPIFSERHVPTVSSPPRHWLRCSSLFCSATPSSGVSWIRRNFRRFGAYPPERRFHLSHYDAPRGPRLAARRSTRDVVAGNEEGVLKISSRCVRAWQRSIAPRSGSGAWPRG